MEIDSGPGPQPTGPTGYGKELSVTGLVSETIGLWSRKLFQYMIIVGIVGLALTAVEVVALFLVFGMQGILLLDFIGTSPLDAVFNLIFGTLTPQAKCLSRWSWKIAMSHAKA